MSDELKMRIFVRDDVKMSRGKYAAQAVHAALLAVGAHPNVPVIVLGAHRQDIESKTTVVHDAGRTEVQPGTATAGTDWSASQVDLGPRPSEACEDGRHNACDGYFTWIGPTLCSCNHHDV